jgi:hypothetical protein
VRSLAGDGRWRCGGVAWTVGRHVLWIGGLWIGILVFLLFGENQNKRRYSCSKGVGVGSENRGSRWAARDGRCGGGGDSRSRRAGRVLWAVRVGKVRWKSARFLHGTAP